MELQTDQATPEYSAGEGEKRAFNKFYSNLTASHGVSEHRPRLLLPRDRDETIGDLNLFSQER